MNITETNNNVENAIEIKNLIKEYSDGKRIIKNLSLNIRKGEFIGILGPNGAGKTTTINCITGIADITSGIIMVEGYDNVLDYKISRSKIGLSPQEWTVDVFQTVEEILYFQAGFFGIFGQERKNRIKESLKIFDLIEHKDKAFLKLSGGLKRRTIVAKSLIHNPDIIILDEPTAGIDVETRSAVWKYLKSLHEQKNKTIILTSHYLEEIQELCDRVVIIKSGSIIYDEVIDKNNNSKKLEEIYLTQIAE